MFHLRHKTPKGISSMSTEANKVLVRRFYDEVTNGRNVAALDELLAPNFAGFTGEGAEYGQNREEFKQMLSTMLNAFPDHHQTIHDWIAEGDKVVTRWTAQGTHLREYAGIAPTGKQVKITGMDIFRVVDGKIVEVWAEVNMPGMMEQLAPHAQDELHYTPTPRRDLESLIADLFASPPLAIVTFLAGGVMEVFGTATPLFAQDNWKVETEHWHIHSSVSVVRGVRFERGPGGHGGPGTEVLCIHLLDAANAPLLRFFLTERYDAQGRPIPERFARYEDLKRRYGRRDGQEVVPCENGMLQR
jgi:steroid delta-isomerase-like uncharacterized protein